MELRIQDEETLEGIIAASRDKSGEGIYSLCVGRERLSLKYYLECTAEEGKNEIKDGHS